MKLIKTNQIDIDNQDGFAALVVALIIIIVLSLITVGFAQLMRNDQAAALSKQLSSQAYYAAESGVNDAYEAYTHGFNVSKSSCSSNVTGPGSQYLNTTNNNVNSTTNTSVTCLLMNPDPPNVIIGDINNSQPIVIEMQGCSTTGGSSPGSPQCTNGSPTSVSKINIQWNDANDNNSLAPNCSQFTPAGSTTGDWNYQNLLRIELIPLSLNDTLNRDFLINHTYTAYLCPNNSIGQGNYYTIGPSSSPGIGLSASFSGNPVGNTGSGDILNASCPNSTSPCSVTLNVGNLTDKIGNHYSTYLLVLRSVYPNPITSDITMYGNSANPNGNATPLDIADAQLLVDSTGKAQNVLKRIQVRIPETNQYYLPVAVQEGAVCKEYALVPTNPNTGASNSSNEATQGICNSPATN